MKPTVLIIEDEPAIAETIVYALQTEGLATKHAVTGQEALTLLGTARFDCLVLDIGLPDIGGFELCRTIRKTWTMPILFLTARGEVVDRVVGLEIGADDYMVKPFSPRELTARVRALLRRGRETDAAAGGRKTTPPAPVEETPSFVIDESRRQITYDGAPLELTRYEYRLLKLLIEHPGRVYSRDQLMDWVWDDATASMDRTVDAHIKSVRKKLRSVRPKSDPIRTHRGFGYSLRETA